MSFAITSDGDLICQAKPWTGGNSTRYVWAGRHDVERTDGLVRMSELEVFSADDLSGILEGDATDLLDRTP